jgi:hypothetical protein
MIIEMWALRLKEQLIGYRAMWKDKSLQFNIFRIKGNTLSSLIKQSNLQVTFMNINMIKWTLRKDRKIGWRIIIQIISALKTTA